MDPDRADVERGHPAGDRLLRLRRPPVAALRHQPRLDPPPPLGQSRSLARAAGLVRARPRPQGRAVRARRRGRARREEALPQHRSAALREDQRLDRPPPVRAAGAAVHPRAVALARRAARALSRGSAAGDRHDHAPGVAPRRPGLRGLPPERLGQAGRGAVQRAADRRRAGLGPAGLARGHPRPRYPPAHDQDPPWTDAKAQARPARRRPRRHAGPGERPRGR